MLDVDAQVGGLAIQIGGALIFDPDRSCTLTSTQNIVVLGLLQMRPSSAGVNHLIRFTGVDESKFVGGGHMVLDTDVGLWCLNDGIVDVAGTPRRAWARTVTDVPAGASSVTLQVDPVGWQVGDEVAIAPTLGTDSSGHHDAYDYARVTSVSGTTIGLSTPTKFPHPAVDVGNGVVIAPEVLNLTRNVNIEGTPSGRAHVIFVHGARPQRMSYFGTRWVGPRQPTGERDFTAGVLGRYGIHFHMVGDSSRGSRIVGGVVRDAGGHAFVAHASHGISFTSCVSHNTYDDAYWYDGMVDTRTPGPDTNDLVFQTCVASRVKCDPATRGYRLSGFALGAGNGNQVHDCVAVGVQGNRDASGFLWPENTTTGVWDFKRNVSHNNRCYGTFTWQNTGNPHVVEDFACYHNGTAGIGHGAYVTSYLYRNGYLYKNGSAAIDLHANSNSSVAQRFVGLHCIAGPASDYGVRVLKHTLQPGRPTEFVACRFEAQRKAAIGMAYDGSNGATTPELFDIVLCESTSPLLRLRNDTLQASVVRVQTADETVAATPPGTAGTYRPEWNAMVRPIAPFSIQSTVIRARPIGVVGGGIVEESAASSTTSSTIPVTSATTSTPSTTSSTTTTSTTTSSSTTSSSTTSTTSPASITDGAKATGKASRRSSDPKPGRKK